MKYYCKEENRIIETDELIRKYGTNQPLMALCHHELTVQPDFEPTGFIAMGDGKYAPIESL